MTDAEVDTTAARFSELVTEAIMDFFRRLDETNAEDLVWEWRGHHSLKIKSAAAELIRAVNGRQ